MTDGEPAIQAMLTAVKLARQEETVVTGKARYDSKSKGLVETAHHLVQGVLRAWVASIERRYQSTLSLSSLLVQWGVRHCCWSLTRYTVLEDGLTPYRRWEKGDWMGKMLSTDEHIVETPAGRQLAPTVTRRSENKRWSKAPFAKEVCTPSEPKISLQPALQAQRQVYLTRRVVERFGPTAGCKVCAGRGGSHTHACRSRLEQCSTREG